MLAQFWRILAHPRSENCVCVRKLWNHHSVALLAVRCISTKVYARPQISHELLQPQHTNFIETRDYAKAAKKEKGKKGKGGKGGGDDLFKTISEDQINEMVRYNEMCNKMNDAVVHFQHQLMEKINLRTNAAAYDNIVVSTDSGRFKLMELAQITTKSPTMIAINMDAAPQYIKEVKEALTKSGLNINPQQDGTSLFIPTPKVTKEHREGLVKNARALSTKIKADMSRIQHKYSKELNAQKSIGKTEKQHADTLLMNTFKQYSAQLDSLVENKTKELLNS